MGLRDKLKSVVRRMPVVGEALAPQPSDPNGPGLSPVPDPPPPKKTDSAWSPPPAAEPVAEPVAEESEADKIAKQQARQQKHLAKARKGVLKHLDGLGGSAQMKDLHDFSERRYFIAHRGFSRMMEFYVDEGLVDFDHDSGTCEITEAGRAFYS